MDPRTKRQLQLLLEAGYLSESVALLQSIGVSKAQSVRALEAAGIEPAEAKRLVHESPAWADVRERDEDYLASLERAIRELEGKSGGSA